MAKSLGELRKEEITDAVLYILVEQGPTALSTRTVAEQVGLSKSSLYQHFDSLEDMTLAAMERLHDRIKDMLLIAGKKAESPLHELKLFAESMPQLAPLFAVMPKLKFTNLLADKDWCVALSEHKDWFKNHLTKVMSRAQEAGELRSDIAPLQCLHVYGGLFREIIFMWMERESEEEFQGDEMIQNTWELFIKLMQPQGGTGEYTGPERRK